MGFGASVVNPVACEDKYLPGLVAIMTASEADFKLLTSFSFARCILKRKLYTSWINIYRTRDGLRFSIIGPVVGAPYAVMLFETLLAWGVGKLIFVGWCGGISDDIEIGDIIVPDGSIIDEGTSRHYHGDSRFPALSSSYLCHYIATIFEGYSMMFRRGIIWTTDAIFRETVEKVNYFKGRGALAVEMELSAIFSVSNFRGSKIETAGILIVSDILKGSKWYPGFKTKMFQQARNFVCQIVNDLCYGLTCQ